MVDVLTASQRRHNMRRIKGKDTTPEMLVRRALHARGFRFRLHRRDLLGRPDIVLPRYRAAIFVHGCFWHAHSCPRFKLPETRTAFWHEKFHRNVMRDQAAKTALIRSQWRVLTIWECALCGTGRLGLDQVGDEIVAWLNSDERQLEITGRADGKSIELAQTVLGTAG